MTTLSARRLYGIGVVLLLALFAFEVFNFDTTRFALGQLLGNASFFGIPWAALLATAFCAIDFAGLIQLFTDDADSPSSIQHTAQRYWYLLGAWLLGATFNAVLTWYAVVETLLNHNIGNEVLSRAQLLQMVPIFVAILVWLTRILFIGAISTIVPTIWRLAQESAEADEPIVIPRQPFRPKGRPTRGSTHRPRQAATIRPAPTIDDVIDPDDPAPRPVWNGDVDTTRH